MTKENLKKGLNAYYTYLNATARALGEFYKSYSADKYIAFSRIFNEAAAVQAASNIRILGGSSFAFSCAYEYLKDGEKYLVYHTSAHRYEWRVRDLLTFEKKEENYKKVLFFWGNDELKGKKYIDYAKAELKAVIQGGYNGLINFYQMNKKEGN